MVFGYYLEENHRYLAYCPFQRCFWGDSGHKIIVILRFWCFHDDLEDAKFIKLKGAVLLTES